VLIGVGQLVYLGSGPPIEPASRTLDTTEAAVCKRRGFAVKGLGSCPVRTVEVVTFNGAGRMASGVCTRRGSQQHKHPLDNGGAGNLVELTCLNRCGGA